MTVVLTIDCYSSALHDCLDSDRNKNTEHTDHCCLAKWGFEIREYKPMMPVSTTVTGAELRGNSGFQRQYDSNFGSNENSPHGQ